MKQKFFCWDHVRVTPSECHVETGNRSDSATCSGVFINKLNEVKEQRDSYSENGSGCVIADVSDRDVLRCVRAVMGVVYSEPACQAAYEGDVRKLYFLLRNDPAHLNVQEVHTGDTPLIASCRHGHLNVVRYLLDNKANSQLTNKKQRTCLHYASKRTFSLLDYLMIAILMPILLLGYFIMLQKQRKNLAVMEAVLSTDVSVDAVDYKGNTALHYVCERKSHRLVPLLLQRNAKTNIKNNNGETPLDIATRLKFQKIINMLRKTK